MPSKIAAKTKPKESSVQFMLAEFNRIQSGESYNRSNGDTRVNLYLTLLSITIGSLITLWQLTDKQNFSAVQFFYAATSIFLIFVSMIGIIVFRLLLERWKLSIIYLKKLARIRRWFLQQDISIKDFLVYTTDEGYNTFSSKGFMSSSLVTLVSLLNSICISIAVGFLVKVLFTDLDLSFFVSVVPASIAILLLHRMSIRLSMRRLDQDKYAAFPIPDNPKDD